MPSHKELRRAFGQRKRDEKDKNRQNRHRHRMFFKVGDSQRGHHQRADKTDDRQNHYQVSEHSYHFHNFIRLCLSNLLLKNTRLLKKITFQFKFCE